MTTPRRSSTTRTTSSGIALVFCPQYVYSTVSPTAAVEVLAVLVNVNVTGCSCAGPSHAAAVIVALASVVPPSASWTVTVSVICSSVCGPSMTSVPVDVPYGAFGFGLKSTPRESLTTSPREPSLLLLVHVIVVVPLAGSHSALPWRTAQTRLVDAAVTTVCPSTMSSVLFAPSPAGTFQVDDPGGAIPSTDPPIS